MLQSNDITMANKIRVARLSLLKKQNPKAIDMNNKTTTLYPSWILTLYLATLLNISMSVPHNYYLVVCEPPTSCCSPYGGRLSPVSKEIIRKHLKLKKQRNYKYKYIKYFSFQQVA